MRPAVVLLLLAFLAGCADPPAPSAVDPRTFIITTRDADPAAEVLAANRDVKVFVTPTGQPGAARDAAAEALAVLANAHAGPIELVALPGTAGVALTAVPRLTDPPAALVLLDPPADGARALPAALDAGRAVVLDLYRDRPRGLDGATAVQRLDGDPALLGHLAAAALDGRLPARPALLRGGPAWRLVGARADGADLWLRLKAGGETVDVTRPGQELHLTLPPGRALEVTPHRPRRLLPDEALASVRVTAGADRPPVSVTSDGHDVRLAWERVEAVAPEAE